MADYEVTLKDRGVEVVSGADAYQQEGQMTTFFHTDDRRQTVDSWSVRIASVRTSEVLMIRRCAEPVVEQRLDQPTDLGTFARRSA